MKNVVISIGGSTISLVGGGFALVPADPLSGGSRAPTNGNNNMFQKRDPPHKDIDLFPNSENVVISIGGSTISRESRGPGDLPWTPVDPLDPSCEPLDVRS